MTPDVFAEWLRRQGHHILRTSSSYWFNQGPSVYQAFPYHWIIRPSEQELEDLLKAERIIALRYSTPLDAPEGHISYHAVFEGGIYDMRYLGKWARKNIRRGMGNCSIETVGFERLAEEGWELQRDTLDRQGRELRLAQDAWRTRCIAAAELPGFEAWGALVEGRLAASVITFNMDGCAYMLYQQCLREYLPAHVNNALSFTVSSILTARPAIRSILYGLHSLDAPASVDEFKFRMGYTAKPVRQRVVFHPKTRPIVNRLTHGVLNGLLHRQPGSPILAKAEGMFRFHLQGKMPLEKQEWPAILHEKKQGLLPAGTDNWVLTKEALFTAGNADQAEVTHASN